MCLRFQFCTHQRVCALNFLKKSQIRCTLMYIVQCNPGREEKIFIQATCRNRTLLSRSFVILRIGSSNLPYLINFHPPLGRVFQTPEVRKITHLERRKTKNRVPRWPVRAWPRTGCCPPAWKYLFFINYYQREMWWTGGEVQGLICGGVRDI